MTEQEILRLPEIPEGTPETQLRAIRSYLYRLAEQLQYLLATEREERIRGTEDCTAQAFQSIQKRLLEAPQTAKQLLSISGRQLEEKYVGVDSLESYLQRQLPRWWQLEHQLAILEDSREEPPRDRRERLCLEPAPGVGIQEGDRVVYKPFPRDRGLFQQVGTRWQVL